MVSEAATLLEECIYYYPFLLLPLCSLFCSMREQLGSGYGPRYTCSSEKAVSALPEPDPCKTSLQGAGAAQMCQPQKCKSYI